MRSEAQIAASRASGPSHSEAPPPLSAEPYPPKTAPRTDSPAPNSSSSKENPQTAGKLYSKPATTNFYQKPRSKSNWSLKSPTLAGALHRCWSMETSLFDMEIAKQRENPQSSPRSTSRGTPPQPGTLARKCASWIVTRPACAAATNAPSKISASSATAGKPKISKRTQEFRRIIRKK